MAGLEVASLYGTIALKDTLTSGLQNADKSLSGFATSMGQKLSDIGGKLTLGVTLPIVAFGAAAMKAGTDNAKTLAQLNAVIKSTGGEAGITADKAIKLAESFDKTSTATRDEILSAENLLLTFRHIGKTEFPDATQAVLDMSTALGQDLKSSSIQLGKALDDPVKGITALRRVGVMFSDSQVDMVKKMVATNDLLGAQKLILKEVNTEFGGSAAAAAKADPYAMLNKAFTELQDQIGGLLNKSLTPLVNIFTDLLTRASNLDPKLLEMAIGLAGVAAAAGPLLMILGNIAKAIGFILSPIGLLIAAIGLVGYLAIQHFGGLDKLLVAAATSARQLMTIVGAFFAMIFTTAGEIGAIIRFNVFKTLNDAATSAQELLDILKKIWEGAGHAPTMPGKISTADQNSKPAGNGLGLYGLGITPENDFQMALLGTANQHILGRAGGGDVMAGQTYKVGENGPELLHMGANSGSIASNGSTGYNGPAMLTIALQAQGFEDHIIVNLAEAIKAAR